MDIFFCDVCSDRVTDSHLRRGNGIRNSDVIVCGACIDKGHGKDLLQRATAQGRTIAAEPTLAGDGVIDQARDRAATIEPEAAEVAEIVAASDPVPEAAAVTDDQAVASSEEPLVAAVTVVPPVTTEEDGESQPPTPQRASRDRGAQGSGTVRPTAVFRAEPLDEDEATVDPSDTTADRPADAQTEEEPQTGSSLFNDADDAAEPTEPAAPESGSFFSDVEPQEKPEEPQTGSSLFDDEEPEPEQKQNVETGSSLFDDDISGVFDSQEDADRQPSDTEEPAPAQTASEDLLSPIDAQEDGGDSALDSPSSAHPIVPPSEREPVTPDLTPPLLDSLPIDEGPTGDVPDALDDGLPAEPEELPITSRNEKALETPADSDSPAEPTDDGGDEQAAESHFDQGKDEDADDLAVADLSCLDDASIENTPGDDAQVPAANDGSDEDEDDTEANPTLPAPAQEAADDHEEEADHHDLSSRKEPHPEDAEDDLMPSEALLEDDDDEEDFPAVVTDERKDGHGTDIYSERDKEAVQATGDDTDAKGGKADDEVEGTTLYTTADKEAIQALAAAKDEAKPDQNKRKTPAAGGSQRRRTTSRRSTSTSAREDRASEPGRKSTRRSGSVAAKKGIPRWFIFGNIILAVFLVLGYFYGPQLARRIFPRPEPTTVDMRSDLDKVLDQAWLDVRLAMQVRTLDAVQRAKDSYEQAVRYVEDEFLPMTERDEWSEGQVETQLQRLKYYDLRAQMRSIRDLDFQLRNQR